MSYLRWFPPSLIDEAALGSAIRVLPRFGVVRYSVGTDSTQSRALEILHRLDALGISFVTESQDLGRGRAGRRWTSPPASGLLFSTILPEELRGASLPAVGYWTALAVADSIAEVCSVTLGLKWPNDLLLDGRKCAGILSEARTMGDASRVVVGVGLNVNRPAEVPAGVPSGSAWLSDATGEAIDRTALFATILSSYEAKFDQLVSRPADVIAAWESRAELTGKRVSVSATDGRFLHAGTVLGLTPDGALRLQTLAGLVVVTLGDVDVL
jgi:BirA family biotin operon repressor/biotin-[acetyl-CoA-carboxylase] ligase